MKLLTVLLVALQVYSASSQDKLWDEVTQKPKSNNPRIEGIALISRGKPSTQSSIWYGGEWPLMRSRFANDGNMETNLVPTKSRCAITLQAADAWWMVDLQGAHAIHTVRYWGRSDGANQLLPLIIEYSLDGAEWKRCSTHVGGVNHYGPHETSCNGGVGSKVRLMRISFDHLSLCEVEVFGIRKSIAPGSMLISRGKPTTQHGAWGGTGGWPVQGSYYGNDGNYDPIMSVEDGGNCAVTSVINSNPWWNVNFQGVFRVHEVQIWGRSNVQQTLPLLIQTYNEGGDWEHCDQIEDHGSSSYVYKTTCNGVVASQLRLTRIVANHLLSLCEVDVYGIPVIADSSSVNIVSRGKPTRQSSTYDWVSYGLLSSNYANDGNYQTDIVPKTYPCAITEQDYNMFWSVNLQGTYKIHSVRILGRSDGAGQLLPIRVELSTNDWDYELCQEIKGVEQAGKLYEVKCGGKQADFVRITRSNSTPGHLTLCEVDVMGEVA